MTMKMDDQHPLSGDIHTVAAEIVKKMSALADFPRANSNELADLISKTLIERAGVFDDIRMGRIMGSAIATI